MSEFPQSAARLVGVIRCEDGTSQDPTNDTVAVEEPLEIRVRGRGIAITMRTPGHDAELAAGFLLSEGIVRVREDIVEIAPCTNDSGATGNILNVFLRGSLEVNFDQLTRHVFASSSCGLCGKAAIDAVRIQFPPIKAAPPLDLEVLALLADRMRGSQPLFDSTGGVHAAALFDMEGNLQCVREDVGRHNAVDKLLGAAFMASKVPLQNFILMVSGRASFEILQKALSAAVPIVVSVSAPSSLAVDFAKESGMVLVGFARGGRFNFYSGAPRQIAPSGNR